MERGAMLRLTVLHQVGHAEYEAHGNNTHQDHGVLEEGHEIKSLSLFVKDLLSQSRDGELDLIC
jgi:hypothetical protein